MIFSRHLTLRRVVESRLSAGRVAERLKTTPSTIYRLLMRRMTSVGNGPTSADELHSAALYDMADVERDGVRSDVYPALAMSERDTPGVGRKASHCAANSVMALYGLPPPSMAGRAPLPGPFAIALAALSDGSRLTTAGAAVRPLSLSTSPAHRHLNREYRPATLQGAPGTPQSRHRDRSGVDCFVAFQARNFTTAFALASDEPGFCPVTNCPSTTTWLAQSGPLL